ncbi:helix-turn-helix transcriptional regulator [Lysobacter rhizosphaerae]
MHITIQGATLSLNQQMGEANLAARVCVSRLGLVRLGETGFSIWVQLRGVSWITTLEGRLKLSRGEWIAFEKDSRPSVQSSHDGICLGLVLSENVMSSLTRSTGCIICAGRGSMTRREQLRTLRLWRCIRDDRLASEVSETHQIQLHMAEVQRELKQSLCRCPGYSLTHRRRVFNRFQRARLYLEGNAERIVRMGELAGLANISAWHFSKVFQQIYGESPQSVGARIRIQSAAIRLISTSETVSEISAGCGFDSPCSFARAFRSHYGVSATQCRKTGALPNLVKKTP